MSDKLIPEIKAWPQRPLASHYPLVWLDAIHYKVKQAGRYAAKAVYTVPGLDLEGKKGILGLYPSETEGENFWLSVLTDLNNRGLEAILMACAPSKHALPGSDQDCAPPVPKADQNQGRVSQRKQPAEAALHGHPKCPGKMNHAAAKLEFDTVPAFDLF